MTATISLKLQYTSANMMNVNKEQNVSNIKNFINYSTAIPSLCTFHPYVRAVNCIFLIFLAFSS